MGLETIFVFFLKSMESSFFKLESKPALIANYKYKGHAISMQPPLLLEPKERNIKLKPVNRINIENQKFLLEEDKELNLLIRSEDYKFVSYYKDLKISMSTKRIFEGNINSLILEKVKKENGVIVFRIIKGERCLTPEKSVYGKDEYLLVLNKCEENDESQLWGAVSAKSAKRMLKSKPRKIDADSAIIQKIISRITKSYEIKKKHKKKIIFKKSETKIAIKI